MRDCFQTYCDEYDKLFIPDDVRDEAVINNLIKYFKKDHDKETLEQCIKYWCKTQPDPILVMDFAVQSKDVLEKVLEDQESRKNFNDLLEQTRKRMKEFDDLRG